MSSISPTAQALYFREYATMIGAGVSIARTMLVLGEATQNERLREINAAMLADIQAGSTLSEAMRKHPDAFSPWAVSMVRAGEVGGILDVTMDVHARGLEEMIRFREQYWLYAEIARLKGGEAQAQAQRERVEKALAEARERSQQTLFCRALGDMLGAGVPFLMALDCAAELLDPGPREAFLRYRQRWRDEEFDGCSSVGALAEVGVFSAMVVQLWAVGEETGALDVMMRKCAELLELETMTTLREALSEGE